MAVKSFDPFAGLPRDRKSADKFRAAMLQAHAEAESDVARLTQQVDAEYAFESLVVYELSQIAGGYRETQHGGFPALIELAAFHLYPRFGAGGTRDGAVLQAWIDALEKLDSLRGFAVGCDIDFTDKELFAIQSWIMLRTEMVRGSTYPPHLRERIEQVQVPFDNWFANVAGIAPSRALAVVDAYEHVANENFCAIRERLNELMADFKRLVDDLGSEIIAPVSAEAANEKEAMKQRFASFIETMPISFAASRAQIAVHVPNLSNAEWEGLRNLIGLTTASRNTIDRPRDVRTRPLYFLSGDRFLFFDKASLYDALFEAFDQLTRTDKRFRDREYIPNLSKWTETKVRDCLLRLFPADNVFTSLIYPDPDHPGGEAELDSAVLWSPFLILGEVKGRQFRPRARTGDPARLRDDLRANIEDAFDQAARAMRYIESVDIAMFTEKSTGRKLEVRRDRLQRIFPVSITLHHFAGLTTQLALLKNIGLFKNSAYPWSVSLGDFDIITRFAGTPDVFLHFIQRRLDLQRSEKDIRSDELDLFGTYLDSRLHPSQFWESRTGDEKSPTVFMISGGSERFDEWHEAELGRRQKHPTIQLAFPPQLTEVLYELRSRGDDGSRWIAFALLDLSPGAVSQLDQYLHDVRKHAEPGSRLPRATLKDGDVAVSIIGCNGLSPEELERQAVFRVNLEKYRLRTSASLLIAIDVRNRTQPFEFALWAEGPWVHEEFFENQLAIDKPTALISDRIPGRNERCPCGSGKKFKKCCMGKVRLERRSN
jgi:hypothetical protein